LTIAASRNPGIFTTVFTVESPYIKTAFTKVDCSIDVQHALLCAFFTRHDYRHYVKHSGISLSLQISLFYISKSKKTRSPTVAGHIENGQNKCPKVQNELLDEHHFFKKNVFAMK